MKLRRFRFEQRGNAVLSFNVETSLRSAGDNRHFPASLAIRTMKSEDAQHEYAAKALTDAVKKCEKHGVSVEITVQTIISVGVTLLLSCHEASDAEDLLESTAALIRSGRHLRDDA
jgi:hypothetical protein